MAKQMKALNGYEVVDSTARNSIVNENMLINSNFCDVINQRRATTYSGSARYTIDRWYLSSGKNSLIVGDGYVRLRVDTASPYLTMYQLVESNSISIPSVMTLSFYAKASGASKFELYDTGRYIDIGTEWKKYSITFKSSEAAASDKTNGLRVWMGIKDATNPGTTNLPVGRVFDIKWIKLEPGYIATEYIRPNKSEELKKCQRYFVKYNSWQNALPCRGDNNKLIVHIPYLSMRISPTIKYPGLDYSGTTGSGTSVAGTFASTAAPIAILYNTGLNISYPIGNNKVLNHGVAVFSQDLELDAEMYLNE